MFNPMKPHCLDCPYKPPLEREKVGGVEELKGEELRKALQEVFEPIPPPPRRFNEWEGMFT